MFTRKLSGAALVFLLSSILSLAIAGSFTPEVGTTITSTSVTIGWTSTASEQWVRVYNSSAEKIFDSGRLSSSSGQVNFAVASSETLLRVIFYEKTGSWVANERTYNVAIGSTGGGDTLSDLACSANQIAQYDGAEWVCSYGLVDVLDPTIAAILMRLDALESSTMYSIGDVGPAGGRVFKVSDGGLHGLEAAPEDQDSAQWCSTDSNIAGVDDIPRAEIPDSHSGAHNTPLIEAICGASSAAGVAAAYVWPNGQVDGFLPNKEELDLLMVLETIVTFGFGGLPDYWSSSEFDLMAWHQDISGYQGTNTAKNILLAVRAIRAF